MRARSLRRPEARRTTDLLNQFCTGGAPTARGSWALSFALQSPYIEPIHCLVAYWPKFGTGAENQQRRLLRSNDRKDSRIRKDYPIMKINTKIRVHAGALK